MTIGMLGKTIKIVATEIITGEQRVFGNKAQVVDAIIASCSIPGISTPYRIKNEIFCDGGVLNNFPADIIEKNCDKLIGVYVSPPQDIKPEDLNSIKSVTARAYELISYRIESYKFTYCDWFITSKKLCQYGTFERKNQRLEEIFEIGYNIAKQTFEKEIFKD